MGYTIDRSQKGEMHMTNWFDDPKGEENKQAEGTPVTNETSAAPTEPSAPKTPAAPETPVTDETPAVTEKPEEPKPSTYSPNWTQPSASVPPRPYAPPTQQPQPPVYNGTPQTPPSGNWQQPTPPPKKKKRGMVVLASVLSVVCVISLAVSVVLALGTLQDTLPNTSAGDTQSSNKAPKPSSPKVEIAEPEEEGLSSKEIIERNLPSVVTLQIYTETRSFFGDTTGMLTQSGVASGIVWTEDGYIITNSHCVVDENTNEEYPRIDVEMSDGTVYENVTVVGADNSTDLAVIKIDKSAIKGKLSPATFGDSSALSMGDKVIAIGNPGGLGLTASQGIVSGLTRDVYEDTGYAIPCIQIDAAINPGNSGGPLFNAAGQVIAINSSKIVATGYEGLGFAIPINEAKKILDDLVSQGHVAGRVALGITGQTVSTTGIQGFYIASIEKGSCLEGSQARVGDIIIYVDKTRTTDYSELRSALAEHKVGDEVTLTMLRYNEATRTFDQFRVTVALGESKSE